MNLIITCARHLETETQEEIIDILKEFGDEKPEIVITNMSGILTAQTNLDPVIIVRKMREKFLDEPWSIRYCLRVIPIQKSTNAEIEQIQKEVISLSPEILEEETYRISIEKRNSELSTQDLIKQIAKNFKNKVSLEFPDKIVLVEVLGNRAGISILKKSDVLSIEKTKRSMSE